MISAARNKAVSTAKLLSSRSLHICPVGSASSATRPGFTFFKFFPSFSHFSTFYFGSCNFWAFFGCFNDSSMFLLLALSFLFILNSRNFRSDAWQLHSGWSHLRHSSGRCWRCRSARGVRLRWGWVQDRRHQQALPHQISHCRRSRYNPGMFVSLYIFWAFLRSILIYTQLCVIIWIFLDILLSDLIAVGNWSALISHHHPSN